ncbi:recombinase family protein [Intrasporangium calvum]|uniref:recombinase family protein n=1 Tax=Intrasporangium calvum TaxID=53358 RepID=UPI00059CCD7D|nr:recombinase family protein [Intrasporangium calvum]
MSTRPPRRAAVYLRISLDATGEGLAVDRQRKECLAIVKARGWDVTREYVDNSISASDARKNRPGYDALVRDFQAGHYDALVCYDLDRLTRQPRQLEDWIDAAEARGLALVTANGEADLTTDAGRLFARIRLAVARAEVERKSARQRSAARQRSELGKPPLGVRLTGYTPRGELVPEEAAVVRRIFDEFLEVRNLRRVARSLTEDGIVTRRGKPWHPSTVQTILRNPRYAGRAVYQGQQTGQRGAWVPIVTDDEYEAVQAILDNPERVANSTGSTERKHLGSGLYLCAVCRQPLSAWSGARYRCRDGAHVNRSRGPVDQYVRAVIAARLSRPDVADLLAPTTATTAPLQEEVARLRKRLARLDADYDADFIDGPRYKAARDRGREELVKAQAALAAAQTRGELSAVVTAPDPAEAFLAAPLATQRAVVDALAVVALAKGTRYSRTFDPATVVIEPKGEK